MGFNDRGSRGLTCSCYGCTERHVGCHSSCPKYLAFIKENERRKQEERNESFNKAYVYENHERIVKLCGKPINGISLLKNIAANEWKVLIVKSFSASGIILTTRFFISFATLLVKVIAKIFHGMTFNSEIR